jgi:ABC-type Mn2+/Zn2+ transport system ATPase subunit
MTDAASKKIIIIAGPNGAGKTTFARAFLPAEAVDDWVLYDNTDNEPVALEWGQTG